MYFQRVPFNIEELVYYTNMESFAVCSRVLRLQQSHGWHYIEAPGSIVKDFKSVGIMGLIQIYAKIENVEWETAILPLGNDKFFIPIKKLIRRDLSIQEGDYVELSFKLRGI
jgi:hypothetical protein